MRGFFSGDSGHGTVPVRVASEELLTTLTDGPDALPEILRDHETS